MGSIHGFGQEFENLFPSGWIQLCEWHESCTEDFPFIDKLPRDSFFRFLHQDRVQKLPRKRSSLDWFKKQGLLVFGKGVSECRIVVSKCWEVTSCQKNNWYFSDLIQFFILTCSPVWLPIPHSIWSLVQLFKETAHLVTHIGLGFSACSKSQSLDFKLSAWYLLHETYVSDDSS